MGKYCLCVVSPHGMVEIETGIGIGIGICKWIGDVTERQTMWVVNDVNQIRVSTHRCAPNKQAPGLVLLVPTPLYNDKNSKLTATKHNTTGEGLCFHERFLSKHVGWELCCSVLQRQWQHPCGTVDCANGRLVRTGSKRNRNRPAFVLFCLGVKLSV